MGSPPVDPRMVQTLDKEQPLEARPAAPATAITMDGPGAQPVERMVATLSYGDTLTDGTPVPPPPAPVAKTAKLEAVLPQLHLRDDKPVWLSPEGARFQEKSRLGEGGMGEVMLVHDRDIDRNVAVKRMRADQQGPGALVRFVEEIRTVGQLEHPNIVPIHDVGIDEKGQYYFTMKHVQGETLEAIIRGLRDQKPEYLQRYTFAVRQQIFLSMLQAIRYAHANGIIHRDIKPANIMVGPFGEVVVMDWGLARRVREPRVADRVTRAGGGNDAFRTQAGALVGTPAYMSPEQARGDVAAVDVRSDIYALCVVFHEMLSLHHYLEGRTTLEGLLEGVQKDAIHLHFGPTPQQGVPPTECIYLCQKGTAKNPADRFQTVDELTETMQTILRGDIRIQCQVTFTKRVFNEALKAADAHPLAVMIITGVAGFFVLANAVFFFRLLVM